MQIAAIQGERGSNSHMAALQMLGPVSILACELSADVIEALHSGRADVAVLPIENSIHGSVSEHYDLLLANDIRIDAEMQMRIQHNVIAFPGVKLAEVKHLLSHAVALSQCRRWLGAHREMQAMAFYDTAGSVKHVMEIGARDTAGIAPALAAEIYGAEVLVENIEDSTENFTRFQLLRRANVPAEATAADKLSLAFAVEHRRGTLVAALAALADAGADLTRIESRPVPGRPWEYVFFVDFRYAGEAAADAAVAGLRPHCSMVRELGRYKAA